MGRCKASSNMDKSTKIINSPSRNSSTNSPTQHTNLIKTNQVRRAGQIFGGAEQPHPFTVLAFKSPVSTMAVRVSDELLGSAIIPVVVFWIYSGIFDILGDKLNKYKLHSKAEEEAQNNIVPKLTVIKAALLQQALQMALSLSLSVLLLALNKDGSSTPKPNPPLYIIAVQFIVGVFVLDTWKYFTHRCYHANKFLYKHIHSVHHQLVAPYAYGALYTHPLEGVVDHVGASLALFVTGMTPRVGMFFSSLVNIVAVDVHTSIRWPYNILNIFFSNSTAYHDVHHQLYGSKFNFETFFSVWDKVCGSYMPYTLEKRKEGGYTVQPVKVD